MSLLEDFAAALLAPDQACPDGLFSSNGADSASRFAVYRNNVHGSLINALASAYPVTLQLVGDEFFRAMAGCYVQANPPSSPVISAYGATFSSFIQGFEPAASVPYLADVARWNACGSVPITRRMPRRWNRRLFCSNCKHTPNWAHCACNCTHPWLR